jgi:hypothetical protein
MLYYPEVVVVNGFQNCLQRTVDVGPRLKCHDRDWSLSDYEVPVSPSKMLHVGVETGGLCLFRPDL